MKLQLKALIFDVDGTLAETEDVHQIAYNTAFAEAGLDWHWSHELFTRLLQHAGAKEQMRAYATETGTELSDEAICNLHDRKMNAYQTLLSAGNALDLREGVRDLISMSRYSGLKVGLATASHRKNVETLCNACWGRSADRVFDAVATGEEVRKKKPSPEVYLNALKRLRLHPDEAIAIEDSRNGVRSALAAGLKVIVTPSKYTLDDDLSEATWNIPNLCLENLPDPLRAHLDTDTQTSAKLATR